MHVFVVLGISRYFDCLSSAHPLRLIFLRVFVFVMLNSVILFNTERKSRRCTFDSAIRRGCCLWWSISLQYRSPRKAWYSIMCDRLVTCISKAFYA